MRYSKAVLAGLMIVFLAGLGPASPQQTKYPSRYVTVLVPFTVGTAAEILARQYATKLSERMQHPFVVENRPGGGGVVAAQTLLNTRADGYTLMFVSSAFAISPAIYNNLSFDISRDFSGIALVGDSPVVLVVNPSLGVRNQEEFIALARKRPGELNFGSAGIGSATYFGCEYFNTEARLKIVSVPFRGVQEFLTEILGGRIELGCPPVSLALSQIRAGKLMALSVTSKERVKQLPDVPTTSEAGLPGFEYKIWYGMVASSKTPKAIVDQLAKELSAITQLGDISNAMENEGVTPRDLVTGEFDAFIAKEIAKFRDLANASGMTKR